MIKWLNDKMIKWLNDKMIKFSVHDVVESDN
jgi:hypothetical protein